MNFAAFSTKQYTLSEGITSGQSGMCASGLPQAPQLHTPVTMPMHAKGGGSDGI